jgi:oligopeptide transport system ATP-binding protein
MFMTAWESTVVDDRELLAATDIRKHFAPKSVGERLWSMATARARGDAGRPTWRSLGEPVKAVDGVHIRVGRGEIVGLVGESGSGKTTLARVLACLTPASGGSVVFEGETISSLSREEMRSRRLRLRMMSQSPAASLNPYMTVQATLCEAVGRQLSLPRSERVSKARELLAMVKLGPDALGRYPSELSGGQQRRVAIARALVGDPSLVIMDEPVAALDASIQAQIARLIQDLNETRTTAFLVISHNLAMVRYLATRLVVMYRGCVVEEGRSDELAKRAVHPYTADLMHAADYDLGALALLESGSRQPEPSMVGCPYRHSCAAYPDLDVDTRKRCEVAEPALMARPHAHGADHRAACHMAAPAPSPLAERRRGPRARTRARGATRSGTSEPAALSTSPRP